MEKHCAQHYKYFPQENSERPISEFGKYYEEFQPNCKRCKQKGGIGQHAQTDPWRQLL